MTLLKSCEETGYIERHIERRDKLCWIKRIETLQVDGDGVKGRPRKRWREKC